MQTVHGVSIKLRIICNTILPAYSYTDITLWVNIILPNLDKNWHFRAIYSIQNRLFVLLKDSKQFEYLKQCEIGFEIKKSNRKKLYIFEGVPKLTNFK